MRKLARLPESAGELRAIATALTTRMFDESSKGAPKTEALRRSMLALMARTDKPYFAHPAFWAPFVLVGEGSGIRR